MAGAFFEEELTGFDEVGGAGEGAGFAFVEDEEIELGQDLVKAGGCDLDPEVHSIGDDEPGWGIGGCLALGEHFELVVG